MGTYRLSSIDHNHDTTTLLQPIPFRGLFLHSWPSPSHTPNPPPKTPAHHPPDPNISMATRSGGDRNALFHNWPPLCLICIPCIIEPSIIMAVTALRPPGVPPLNTFIPRLCLKEAMTSAFNVLKAGPFNRLFPQIRFNPAPRLLG